jgi:formylglycine-generating enzyme required for sulfatase activity
MYMRSLILFGLAIIAAAPLGCNSENGPTNPHGSLSISPTSASLEVGRSQQFTAVMPGVAHPKVLWEVEGGAFKGAVTASGLYTAPANVPSPSLVTVRATSQADPANTETAVVEVKPATVLVGVEPAALTVRINETQQLEATVTGAEDASVIWSVEGGLPNGSINASGLYTAPGTIPVPARVTVRATSVADPIRFGTAKVTVIGPNPESGGFLLVPSGTFVMGDGWSYCAKTNYQINLSEDFYLSQTEVTNQEYLEMVQWAYEAGYVTATATSVSDAMGSTQEFLNLDGDGSELAFSNGEFVIRDAGHGRNPDHPVKQVTWYGAAAYCDWLSLKEGLPPGYDHTTWQCNGGDPYRGPGYRLPTEPEWEYAAQYDDERLYPWGDETPGCDRANYGGCNDGWTEPVGTQVLGPEKMIGGKGLFDMAGNVWEWCNDWWQCEPNPSEWDPPGPSAGPGHVLKGSSFWQTDGSDLRCATRTYSQTGRNIGFRVVRTVDP